MHLKRAWGAALGAAILLASAACSIGETTHETVTYPARAKAAAIKTCEGAFAKPDLAKLKSCANGNGHCWDKSKVLSTTDLEACDAETVCISNAILEAGGSKLKTCTSLGGKPGACIEPAAPLMVQFADAIPKADCEGEKRCAPCVDVRNGDDTHLCDEKVGVYEEACTGGDSAGAATQSCCHGAGLCMLASGIDEDQREDMTRQTCPSDKLCAPASQANGKPVTCDVAGFDGVCMDICFADMIRGVGKVMRGGCQATEFCLPCFVGKGRGMKGCD